MRFLLVFLMSLVTNVFSQQLQLQDLVDKRKIINDAVISNDISKIDLIAGYLKDDDKLVKMAAIEGLGMLRSSKHEDDIVDILLKERDRDIKNSCIIALSYLYPLKNVDKIIDYYKKERDEVLKTQIVRLLASRNVKKLENEMISIIKSKVSSIEMQTSAIYYLGVIKSTASTTILKDLLNNDDKVVKLEVIRALGEIGDRSTIDILRARVGENDDDIKIESSLALAKMGDNFGVKEMYKYIDSTNLSHRERALIVIGSVGDQDSIKILEEKLSKTNDQNLKSFISFTIEKIKARNRK